MTFFLIARYVLLLSLVALVTSQVWLMVTRRDE
jgi:hypothetical protein